MAAILNTRFCPTLLHRYSSVSQSIPSKESKSIKPHIGLLLQGGDFLQTMKQLPYDALRPFITCPVCPLCHINGVICDMRRALSQFYYIAACTMKTFNGVGEKESKTKITHVMLWLPFLVSCMTFQEATSRLHQRQDVSL